LEDTTSGAGDAPGRRLSMAETHHEAGQDALTLKAMHRAGLSTGEVWTHYMSMGGFIEEYEVNAYLNGLLPLVDLDRDMISQAVNELYDDICRGPRAPYSQPLNG
jgi:hypothetical protein